MFRTHAARLGLVTVALGLVAAFVPTVATADTASDLSDARRKVADAQAAANAVAADLNQAEGRFQDLSDQISQLEASIQAAQERAGTLQAIVRDRAVSAYTRGGRTDDLGVMSSSDRAIDAIRRSELVAYATRNDNRDVRKLAALRADLHEQEKSVRAQRDEQQKVKDQLASKSQTLQAALVAANTAKDELVARLEREQAAAAAAELARLKAEQLARQAIVAAGAGSLGGGAAGQIIVNPGGGAFQCPVAGSAYSDSYGPRADGFHSGIDMIAPAGVPEVAVKAGTVSYIPNGGAGGNEAYLAANDGNVYYYAHMSAFVGGPRSVAQGEIIGLVGSTGRSTGPHLHFEIRLGGANGQRIDPYATLRSAGC